MVELSDLIVGIIKHDLFPPAAPQYFGKDQADAGVGERQHEEADDDPAVL